MYLVYEILKPGQLVKQFLTLHADNTLNSPLEKKKKLVHWQWY